MRGELELRSVGYTYPNRLVKDNGAGMLHVAGRQQYSSSTAAPQQALAGVDASFCLLVLEL